MRSCADIAPVDLLERAEALLIVGPADMQPVGGVGIGERLGGDGHEGLRLRNDGPALKLPRPRQGCGNEVRLGHHPSLLITFPFTIPGVSSGGILPSGVPGIMVRPDAQPPCASPFSAAASSRAYTAGTCGRCSGDVVCSYASRDGARAEAFCRRYRRRDSYADYGAAIADPRVDAVVIAVPPRFHLDLTLQALDAGKHVLVEKPAFPRIADYRTALDARNQAGRVVLVGENDHYKPLAVCLRRLLERGAHRRDGVRAFHEHRAKKLKTADDWRNDETMAGGDAFFEEGIHWLHLAAASARRSRWCTAIGRPCRGTVRTGASRA